MGDSHMALQARLMSQALRKLTANISKTHCMVIFINQIRSKIGVMFGNPETTTGGNALKFYCSVRLDIRRIGQIKAGNDVIGRARGKGGEEQDGAAVSERGVRHHVWGRDFAGGDIIDLGARPRWWKKAGRGMLLAESGSARAGRTRRRF